MHLQRSWLVVGALAFASLSGCLPAKNTEGQLRSDDSAPSLDTGSAEVSAPPRRAFRASILSFNADPDNGGANAYQYFEDGLLLVEQGKVVKMGTYDALHAELAGAPVVDYRGHFIMPGFLDTHIHFPQTEMIGAYGEELLKWLETYTFPTERQFKDKEYARAVAKVFLDELLRNGTTTALVFATVHKESTEALFEEAAARNMRIIAGKVLMDRNAPDYLRDTPETAYSDSKALIDSWHKKGRALYAVTPRFAPTSSPDQLRVVKRLLDECRDCYMHTHVSENKGEVEWVKSLFANDVPAGTSYLGVYNHFGLMTPYSVFAHAIHFDDSDFTLLTERKSAMSFCPTSNLFLGSGLFDFDKARTRQAKFGIGTDVGAGTSFSILQTLNEAYKVVKLRGGKLSSLAAFYLATLGSAKALSLDDRIGSFRPGNEADFVVLDPTPTPILKFRMQRVKDWQEKLFVLMTMGDDRSVRATYVAGRLAHARNAR